MLVYLDHQFLQYFIGYGLHLHLKVSGIFLQMLDTLFHNLHLQMDGICSEAYLPGLPLWIQGCLGDEWDALDEIDLPALMLGFLTPRTLLSVDRPEVFRKLYGEDWRTQAEIKPEFKE